MKGGLIVDVYLPWMLEFSLSNYQHDASNSDTRDSI